MGRSVERKGGPAYSKGACPETNRREKAVRPGQDGPGARLTAGVTQSTGNRTAGLAAAVLASTPPPRPRLPLAALSSVASQPGWLPPPPCQGLPGSPLRVVPEARQWTDPASYSRALLLVVGAEVVVLQPDRLAVGRLAERVVGDFLVRGGRWVDR